MRSTLIFSLSILCRFVHIVSGGIDEGARDRFLTLDGNYRIVGDGALYEIYVQYELHWTPETGKTSYSRYARHNVLASSVAADQWIESCEGEVETLEWWVLLKQLVEDTDATIAVKDGDVGGVIGRLMIYSSLTEGNPVSRTAYNPHAAKLLDYLESSFGNCGSFIEHHRTQSDLDEATDLRASDLNEEIDGAKVRIQGWVVNGYLTQIADVQLKDNTMYLSGESFLADRGLIDRSYEGQVLLEGIIIKSPTGPWGIYNYRLERITRFTKIGNADRKDPSQRLPGSSSRRRR